jgi:hypothetical protein
MTEAQAAWLRKLRDEGPQVWRECPMADYRRSRNAGWEDLDDDFRFIITPAGLAALAEREGE